MMAELIPEDVREKLKHCFECGICTASCPMAEVLAPHYNPRTLLQRVIVEPEKTLDDSNLWLCAWCYRCFKRCPQGLKPPEIFHLLKEEAVRKGVLDGFEQAVSTIGSEVPLGAVCLYTCFHHERAGLGAEEVSDTLEALPKREQQKKEAQADTKSKGKVAVIGSGPAGLTATYNLSEKGYSVTVYEALPKIGGMLTKSMPEYRLPKDVLSISTRFMKGSNVELKKNTAIGKDITFDRLQDAFDAIFIAVGAHKSRRLGIENEESQGVLDALDFLWKVGQESGISVGKKVGIIGGGNVAVDAARTAVRQGADDVTILYRRSRAEMPANPWEVKEAEEEGVNIELLVAPKRILAAEGKVVGLECVRMELGDLDESGRRKPLPIENSEFTLKLDTVIVAIGEKPQTTFLPTEIALDKTGRILVNPITMETTMRGIFAGGDTVTGPATVIEAINAGRRAACGIDSYLTRRGREVT